MLRHGDETNEGLVLTVVFPLGSPWRSMLLAPLSWVTLYASEHLLVLTFESEC